MKKKKEKQKLTKRDYKILGITAASAIIIGTCAGIVIKRLGEPVADYGALAKKIAEYEADTTTIMNKYYAYANSNDIENTNLAKTKSFTAAEMINISLNKYRDAEYSYSFGTGVGKTIVNQEIRSFQIRYKDIYFEESISAGFVSLANRYIQNGDIVTEYKGSLRNKDVNTASYKNEGNEYSLEKYKERMGRTLSDMFIYVISDKTVNENSIQLENDKYLIDVTLNQDIAAFYYVKQMKTISNLDTFPTFYYIKLHFELNRDLVLQKMSADELYKAKLGVDAKIHSNLDYYYFQDSKFNIPSLQESLTYGGLLND